MDKVIEQIKEAMLEGEAEQTMDLVQYALTEGVSPDRIIEEAIVEGMSTVGRDFKNGEFYIPDVLMAARASQAVLYFLGRRRGASYVKKDPKGVIVVGTVAGDLHDIGKNIAAYLYKCEGYEVVDLGIDVVPEAFVAAVVEHKPIVVGLSALLTTTIGEMGNVIKALDEAGLRESTRVYVSGVPVTQAFADSIGADKYCADVRESLDYVKALSDE